MSPSNRSILQTTIQPLNPTIKNQLEDTNGDYVYDAVGNLTQPGPIGGPYVYDAENHLTSADGVTYTYDGDGNRVMKSNGTIYWYGANSASLEESDLSGNLQRWYYFFDGQRVGRSLTTNEVGFYMTDALGSVRYLGGSATGYRFDYFPFGAPILDSDTGDDRYQFTGKERDSESGLDDFGARYFGSSLGRFMSPDGPFSDQNNENPQSWNLYTYARNNPLRFTDADGRACVQQEDGSYKTVGTEGQSCEDAAAEEAGDNHVASAVVTPSHDDQIKMFAEDIGNIGTAELKQDVLIMAAGAADAAATSYILRIGAEAEEEVAINSQKQDGHVKDTPQYKNRIKGGKSTSAFRSRKMADKLTRDTWDTGTPQPDGSRIKDYGRPIAEGPNGGTQTKVRVTQDASGQIHGTPWGPVTP